MTTIKNTLIYFATIVSVGSFAHADIANPDFREGRPMKFTIIGHTGQDPAPKRDESTWDGPGFSDPTWFDGYVEKEPLPTKDTLFSIIYEEKPVNTTDYLKVPHHLSNEFVFSVGRFGNSTSVMPPNNGAIPAPPASLLFALGFLKKRRRVE